jgi:hypothetical protein
MADQIHKKFTDEEVKRLLERYVLKEVDRKYIQELLGIKKSRFFELIKMFRDNKNSFSIEYNRNSQNHTIDSVIENNIIMELKSSKELIENKKIPIRSYNYSYIREKLSEDYQQKVSLNTIISRARKHGFYIKKQKKKIHAREVLTENIGELIQHDSSPHLWAPAANKKWHLITSLDDHSRFILYGKFVEEETSWSHIESLQSVFLKYGMPYEYYVDSHSIFRFVKRRDSFVIDYYKMTDEATPQWKQVLNDCNVKVCYALSPQAKGKIERPYRWLQDRVVRECIRYDVSDLQRGQSILDQVINRYNYHLVHSTTQEVPYFRFKQALKENKSFFRPFHLKAPYTSVKDIFCLRMDKIIDPYRCININNNKFKIKANPHDFADIRIYPLNDKLLEFRVWIKDSLADIIKINKSNVPSIHY